MGQKEKTILEEQWVQKFWEKWIKKYQKNLTRDHRDSKHEGVSRTDVSVMRTFLRLNTSRGIKTGMDDCVAALAAAHLRRKQKIKSIAK